MEQLIEIMFDEKITLIQKLRYFCLGMAGLIASVMLIVTLIYSLAYADSFIKLLSLLGQIILYGVLGLLIIETTMLIGRAIEPLLGESHRKATPRTKKG